MLAETLALYESDPEAAAESITAYTIELQEKALADANQMYDELTWYMIANTNTLRYDVTNGDIEEWEPFVPSLAQTVDTSEDAAA